MWFIKLNLLLGDGVWFVNNNNHPPHSPFKVGGLNLTSSYISFIITSFPHFSFSHKVLIS